MAEFLVNVAEHFEKTVLTHLTGFAGQKLDYLEVGVFEGKSAHVMAEHVLTHPESTYTGIDNWVSDSWRIKGTTEPVWVRAKRNLAELRNVTLMEEPSAVALQELTRKKRKFDITYIDGNHRMSIALLDTVLTWDMTKHIMIWDDYRSPGHPGVEKALTALFKLIPRKTYKVIENGYQFAIKKQV